jgi:TusA-related sulfurtransferase
MTWVRTKLALERLPAGETLEVLVPPGEAETNVPRSAREAGHSVSIEGTTVRIVRRDPRSDLQAEMGTHPAGPVAHMERP